jgi:serine protease Do
VTAGIISARGRDINAGPYDDFFQTDASINRGNSGGPLFNMDGRVIGINTAIFSPSGGSVGIGFAIPAALAQNVIEQLEEHGRTRRGWLGVRIQTVTDEIAESLGLKDARGALVAGLSEDGPAAKAGIKQGDIILRFDDKEVEEMRALPRIVAETRISKAVPVELWRDEKRVKVEVSIGELELAEEQQLASADPKSGPSPRKVETLGMTLSGITPDLRDKFELREDAAGVVVTEVNADSAAAEKGIREGDIIVEVGQEEVSKPEQVKAKVGQVQKSKRKSILLLLERGGDLRFVAVRLDES